MIGKKSFNLIEYKKIKSKKRLSRRKVYTFFTFLLLALVNQPYYYFIKVVINLIISLIINKNILIKKKITIDFIVLFL